jgi:hypothetical protein
MGAMVRRGPLAQQSSAFAGVGKSPRDRFVKQHTAGGAQLKYAAFTLDKRRFKPTLSLNLACQPGRFGKIVSNAAVGDFDVHGVLLWGGHYGSRPRPWSAASRAFDAAENSSIARLFLHSRAMGAISFCVLWW